ncbi:MAG: crossover junction endodeoxyribonuclease RuvC [Candidatus Paceibacterota bacterium]
MKILGIDPGSTRAGYAVIEYESLHKKPVLITAGILKTNSPDKNRLLAELFTSSTEIIKKYLPDIAGIETLRFAKNVTTGIEVAQSRGVLICTIVQHTIPLYEFSPLEIKQGITGYGNADKHSVIRAVQQTIDASSCIGQPDDVFDAIAIALVTAYAYKNLKKRS